MSTLDVLLDGAPVAKLDDAAGAGLASLVYTDEAVSSYPEGAPLLSVRLPVRSTSYPGTATRAWLDGLLPEADARDILARRAKLDPSDLAGLIRAYGEDCAGAVSVVPPGDITATPSAGVQWLSDEELALAIRELPRSPFAMSPNGKVRVSLPGVQGKLVVVLDDESGRLGLPEGLQPSTHILKPAPLLDTGAERFPGIVTAEAMCLRFLGHLGLDVPSVTTLDLPTGPALLVTRYDRRVDDGGEVHRLHQEDLCQALGVPTVNKYEESSPVHITPSLKGLVDVLRTNQAATAPTLIEVLGRVTANVLVTNCDAHGKNWSFTLPGVTIGLAPAYDVVPSTLWPNIDTALAMHVGGCTQLADVRAVHLLDEAERWDLGRPAAGGVLDRIRAAADASVDRAGDETIAGGGDPDVVELVADIMCGQVRRVFGG